MNSHDLKRMNDHDYLTKKKSLNLTIRQEKYIACILWGIAITWVVLLLILVFK